MYLEIENVLAEMDEHEMSEFFNALNRKAMLAGASERCNTTPGSLKILDLSNEVHGVVSCTAKAGRTRGSLMTPEEARFVPVHELRNLHCGERTCEARIEGQSMEPVLHDGDRVVFSPDRQVLNNRLAVVLYDDEMLVKVLCSDEEHGCYWLVSINEKFPPIQVLPGDNFGVFGPYAYTISDHDENFRDVARAAISRYREEHPEEGVEEEDEALPVHQVNTARNKPQAPEAGPAAEEFFHFIHPAVTDDGARLQISREIENLLRSHPLPDLCAYLKTMEREGKILLPLSPQKAIQELQRMGMPKEDVEGFTYKNFCKYYTK